MAKKNTLRNGSVNQADRCLDDSSAALREPAEQLQDELDQAQIGESLLAASDEVLASIPQITMEMHGYDPKIV